MAYAGSCGTDNILAAVPTILKWGIPTAFALPAVSSMWTVLILLAGVIGAFITVTVVRSMADLGPARAAMLIVISQLAVAYVIERFGMFGVEKQPFEWRKLIGLLISVTGIIVFKW